ncbi:MAG: hypothetical protein JF606_28470 [Burkholderiales bacterium]|nr:hypothetical protein [Burkholderiales bacterium]
MVIPYDGEADLKSQIQDLASEIHHTADLRNCVVHDLIMKNQASGQHWDGYRGGWQE